MGHAPTGRLGRVFATLKAWDAAFDTYLKRFPRVTRCTDAVLEWLFGIFSNGAFALIVALILFVLAGAGNYHALCIWGAWAIAIISVARAPKIKQMAVASRAVTVIAFGILLAWAGSSIGRSVVGSGQDSRGYLSTEIAGASFDPRYYYTDGIKVSLKTTNTGALQILPGARMFAYIRFRPEMSAAEEDRLFGTWNLGGGRSEMGYTERGYWDKGSSIDWLVSGTMDFYTPQQLTDEWKDFFTPGSTLRMYVYVRHIAKDVWGREVTENCYLLSGADILGSQQDGDLPEPHLCHGHNGPAASPSRNARAAPRWPSRPAAQQRVPEKH